VRVVFSPGHTPGHICLYHERSRTLIAGDALTAEDGRLRGPNPSATPDMPLAAQSVRKLAALDVQAIVCYHGGVVDDDAQGQLRRVADELAV
jgi:glyoxylase-like metal-dependent hydrolase (beta-lactamase superfamily II)